MKNEQVQQTQAITACKIESIKLGIDLHAATAMVVAQFDHALPKPGQRIDTDKLLGWVAKLKAAHPAAALHACYEAGPCGYWLHRELIKQGVRCHVVAPVALNGRRKTDKRDARALCDQLDRFVRGNTQAFSEVYVPSEQQEDERALLRHRRKLVGEITRCSAAGRSAFLRLGRRVRGSWWQAARWQSLAEELPAHTRFGLAQLRDQLALLRAQLREADQQVAALAERRAARSPGSPSCSRSWTGRVSTTAAKSPATPAFAPANTPAATTNASCPSTNTATPASATCSSKPPGGSCAGNRSIPRCKNSCRQTADAGASA